jgi:hypothetical protein
MPELLTTKQVATRLGVSPRRVRALAEHRADFPAPAVRTPNLLWLAEHIDTWNNTANRSPGRRTTTQRTPKETT